ncbi:MAG: hypothetical protein Q7W30_09885 [Coriobacteriia bacterium]|nr:hypothetical protein [Coriobacteriia bacterium]
MGFWTSDGMWPRLVRRWVSQVLAFCMVMSFVVWTDYRSPARAVAADPDTLVVSKTSSGEVLLGGQVSYAVRVMNPNSYKVYNISVQDVVSSSRVNPQGRVSFVSATDKDGNVVPTTNKRDAVGSGDTTMTFVNIRDLAPGETYDLNLTFSIDPTKTGDASWVINDLVVNSAVASGNVWPDGLGAPVPGAATATASAKVVPIILEKTTNQSTGVDQASGTEDRPYTYTLVVRNNYTTQTASVVVTDTLPDGVEYLGMASGTTPTVVTGPDPVTGITTLVWNLGTFAPSTSRMLVPRTGIRYDYFGTDSGGVGRPTASIAETHGVIIPHGTTFLNSAVLSGIHSTSTVATDAATSSVTAAYFTGNKSSSPGNGGPGTIITHSLSYYTSQYYSVIDSGSIVPTTTGSIIVHDKLPDGQTLETSTCSVAPDDIVHNTDGTTDIYWKRPAFANSSNATITFDAVVDNTWEGAPLTGQPVRAGDSMVNNAAFSGIWQDLIDATHTGNIKTIVAAAASASFSTPKPRIVKRVRDLKTGLWATSTSATVGDVLHFRVQFNASDTVKPLDTVINKGNIEVTDWLPPGVTYVPGSAVTSYSSGVGDFADVGTRTVNLTTPTTLGIGGLSGIQWFLGDVVKPGWWECEFDAVVTNSSAIAQGGSGDNMWKLTGINSFGVTYSERDTVKVNYAEPVVTVAKGGTNPAVLRPGVACTYTVTLTNTSIAAARDILVTDTIPAGMRNTTPTITGVTVGGVPRTNPGSWATTYTMSTGLWLIDFNAPGVNTTLPAGATMTVTYLSSIDTTSGASRPMRNDVTVRWGSSDTTVSRPYGPVTANRTVTLPGVTIAKAATPTTVTVGDTVTYRLRSRVPTGGVLWWPRIDDAINSRGFEYVPGSARIVDVTGTPSVPATFSGGISTPATQSLTPTRTIYRWLLADPIDNRGSVSAYEFDLYFDLRCTADSSGTALFLPPALIPAAHNSVLDSGTIVWNDTTATTRPAAPNRNAVSTNVPTVLDQPWLLVTKANLNATAPVGASAIPYRVTVSNRGYATAHDILWTDVLPPAMRATTPTLDSVKLNGVTISSPAYIAPVWDSTTGSYTIDFYNGGGTNTPLSSGSTFTVDLTCYANVQPSAGQALVNTATVAWSTTTTPAIGRFYPMSLAPAPNTGVATATIALPTIEKYTLETSTQPGFPTEYRFRVTIPTETIVTDLSILDVWSTNGFGAYGWLSSVDIAGSPDVPAVLSMPGLGDLNTNNPSPGSSLLFKYFPTPGTLTIDNADAVSSAGDTPYVFELRYKVGPGNTAGTATPTPWIWDPYTTGTITDQAALSWMIGGVRASTLSTSVSLPVNQPVLRTAKVPSISSVQGGDVVTFTVTVTNIGAGYAYEYDLGPSLVDTLPAGLINPVFVSVTHSANGLLASPADYSATTAGGVIKVDFNEPASAQGMIAPGQSIAYVYRAQVDPAIGAGSVLVNTADANWSSALGYNWTADQQYNDTDPLDPTVDTTTAVLTVPSSGLVKAALGSVTTATIGTQYWYGVTATVPANTTMYNTTISDFVPDGLTVIGTTRSAATGTVSIGAKLPDGRTPVVWSVGDVSNPPTSTLELRIHVNVEDTYAASGLKLDGLPPAVDGDVQETIVNTGSVSWDTAKTGGTPRSTVTPPATVTLVEPHLRTVKRANVATAAAGQVITYTIEVGNDGLTSAANLYWSDATDNVWLTDPGLVSVSIAGTPLVDGVDFTSYPGTNQLDFQFWYPTEIPAGATMTIVTTAAVLGGVPNNHGLWNIASVMGYDSTWSGTPRNYNGPTATLTVPAKAPGLVTAKSVVGDTFVQAGQVVQYRYVVRNVGEATATAASFADAFSSTDFAYEPGTAQIVWPGGSTTAEPALGAGTVSWSNGSEIPNVVLAPSQSATLTFSLRVAALPALGSKTDTATATARDLAGVAVPASSGIAGDTDPLDRSIAAVTVTRPHVAVDKALAPAQDAFVALGSTVSYTIRITNDGSSVLTTIPLSDAYDASRLAFVSASPSVTASSPGSLSWSDVTAPTLAAGASTTVTVTFRAIATGTSVSDTATVAGARDVNGDTPPTVSDTDSSATLTNPHVAIDKVLVSSVRASLGSTVTYQIGITNDGDTVLTSVPVTDTFSSSKLALLGASPGYDSTGTGFAHWNDVTGAGWLAVGQTTTITVEFRAIATGTAVPDTATVSAALDANGDTPPLATDTEKTLTITRPHLTVDKALASGQKPVVGIGGTVDYTIRITNDGETTVTAIPLTDVYDATRLEFYSTATPAPDVSVIGQLSWLDVTGAGSLAPGASTTVTVGFSVIASGASVPDTATIAGAVDEDGNPVPPATDTEKTLTATRPHVAITKSLAPGQDAIVPVFETITYDIVITNDGETTLETVPLGDQVWTMNATYVSATPPADDSSLGIAVSWNDVTGPGVLAVGESTTVTVTFQPLMAAVPIWNVAGVGPAIDTNGDLSNTALAPELTGFITNPHLAVNKVLTSPALSGVGALVTYDIGVTNDGDTAMASVPVTDTFDAARLEFVSASPAQDSTGAGFAHFDDITGGVGLAVGQTATVTVTFRAIAPGVAILDTATVDAAIDVNGDTPQPASDTEDTLALVMASVGVDKHLAPTQDPFVPIGGVVEYEIVARNDGGTTLTVVPLADTYDATRLSFLSATPSEDASGPGTLSWSDLTGGGDLTAGGTTTVTVRFAVIAAGSSVTDTATIANAEDVNGIIPPTVSDIDSVLTATRPHLAVTKAMSTIQDPWVPLGSTVSYDLVVTNDGDTTMTTLPVVDTFDGRLSYVISAPSEVASTPTSATWNLDGLAPGATTTITVALRVTAPGISIPDTVTISGAVDEHGDVPPTVFATDYTLTGTDPHVAVKKQLAAGQDPIVALGDTVTYDIGVHNGGDTTLVVLPLADAFDASRLAFVAASPAQSVVATPNVTWADLTTTTGDLAPGASTTVTITFRVTAPGVAITDTATVSGAIDVNGDTPPTALDADSVLTGTRPHIAIDKKLALGQDPVVALGGTVTYDIVVTNDGDTTLTAVPLADTFDSAHLAFVSALPLQSGVATPNVTWADLTATAGDLAPGASTTVTATFRVTAPGAAITDTATVAGAVDVNGDVPPTVTDADAVLTGTNPLLDVTKDLAPAQDPIVALGDTVTYAIRISNTGDTAMDVVPLADAFDAAHLAFVSASPAESGVTTPNVTWADVTGAGSLAAGDSTTVTVTFRVTAAGAAITDTATVSGAVDVNGDTPPTVTDDDTVLTGTRPHVAIVKQLAGGQPLVVPIGHTVTYDIGVTNDGDTTLTTVPLADAFDPIRLDYIAATPGADLTGIGTANWLDVTGIGDLVPGQTTTVSVTFRVISNGPAVLDVATVAGALDVNDDTAPTATDDDSVLTATKPLLAIAKTLAVGQDPIVALGGTVTYDIAVTNVGDTTMTAVPLFDTFDATRLDPVVQMPAAGTGALGSLTWLDITGPGTLAPGASTTVTATFRVIAPGVSVLNSVLTSGGVDTDGYNPPPTSTVNTVLTATNPHLSITKLPASTQATHVPLYGQVTWDIRVLNDGDTTMTTVALADTYDAAHLEFVSASPSEDASGAGSLTWSDLSGAGDLAPGESTTVTVTFRAIAPVRPVVNIAAVTGAVDVNDDVPPLPSDTDTSVILTDPHLSLTKELAPGEHPVRAVGQTVTYRMTVVNDGDTTLTTVPLEDAFDDTHIAFESATPGPDTTSSTTLTWADLTGAGSLAPAAATSVDVTFRVTAAGAAIPDTASVLFAVDEFGDMPPNALALNEVLGAFAPGSISVTKTATPPHGTIALPGDTITYTVTWANSSQVTITAASIVDTLSNAAEFQPGSILLDGLPQTDAVGDDRAGYAPVARTVVVAPGDLAPGGSGMLTFRVTVGPEEISRFGLLNVATLAGPDLGAIETSQVFHPVDPFTITKRAVDLNGGKLKPGDVIEWVITVENTGLTQTTHVRITDTVPAGTTYVRGSMVGTGASEAAAPDLVWDIGTMEVSQTVVVTFRTRVNAKLPNNYRIRNVATVASDQSRPKSSDDPATPSVYDPTVVFVRTSGDELLVFGFALLALLTAGVLAFAALRRRRESTA